MQVIHLAQPLRNNLSEEQEDIHTEFEKKTQVHPTLASSAFMSSVQFPRISCLCSCHYYYPQSPNQYSFRLYEFKAAIKNLHYCFTFMGFVLTCTIFGLRLIAYCCSEDGRSCAHQWHATFAHKCWLCRTLQQTWLWTWSSIWAQTRFCQNRVQTS